MANLRRITVSCRIPFVPPEQFLSVPPPVAEEGTIGVKVAQFMQQTYYRFVTTEHASAAPPSPPIPAAEEDTWPGSLSK